MTTLLTFAPPDDAPETTVWVCDDRACTALTVAGALPCCFEPDEMVVFAPGETGPGDETVVPTARLRLGGRALGLLLRPSAARWARTNA